MKMTTDTLLLASACPVKTGLSSVHSSLLDAGCGAGSLGLSILERCEGKQVNLVGVDISNEAIEATPDLEVAKFYRADLLSWDHADLFNSFSHVVTNPPYFSRPTGRRSSDEARELARGSDDEQASKWFQACFKYLKPGGWLSLIWLPNRISILMAFVNDRISHLIILPISTRMGKGPTRLIVLLRKPTKKIAQPMLNFLPPLQFYGDERLEIERWITSKYSVWRFLQNRDITIPQVLNDC